MSEDELLAAGYRAFKPNGHDRFDMLYSKRVTDEVGIRYAVHVRLWDFRKYGAGEDGWDAEVISNDGADWWVGPLWLKTSCRDKSVAEVERWADQLWTRLALNYYERWEE